MITASVLAAGLSSRMQRFKPVLPYGGLSVIQSVIAVLRGGSLGEILVITGHEHDRLDQHLAGWPVRTIFNPDYATGEMLSSIQVGLRSADPSAQAALIALGDQPMVEQSVVDRIVEAASRSRQRLVVPSYQMRRGHPFLIDRSLWKDVLALNHQQSLRDFFKNTAAPIHYVEVTTSSVLRDLDTPADYERELAAQAAPIA